MSFDVTQDEARRILDEAQKRAARSARRGQRGRPRADQLKAWYTIPELAQLAGMTRRQMEGALPEDLIDQRNGPRTMRRVYLTALKNAAPKMWASILDKLQAQRTMDEAA